MEAHPAGYVTDDIREKTDKRPFQKFDSRQLEILKDSLEYGRANSSENKRTCAERNLLIAQIEIEEEIREDVAREAQRQMREDMSRALGEKRD